MFAQPSIVYLLPKLHIFFQVKSRNLKFNIEPRDYIVSLCITPTAMTGSEVAETNEPEKKVSDWAPVSLPKALLLRIGDVYEKLGYRSRAEYVRYAILKQLDADERLGKHGGNADGDTAH